MREFGTPLITNGRSPLLLLVSGKFLKKKQPRSIARLAMDAIFNTVSMKKFKRISNVKVAHTAWNILQTVHEGTKVVKINKL